jgi:hypothetical protein
MNNGRSFHRKIYHRIQTYCLEQAMVGTPKSDVMGILSSPTCRSVNGVDIFYLAPRSKRSHDHCHCKSPILHNVLLNYYTEADG